MTSEPKRAAAKAMAAPIDATSAEDARPNPAGSGLRILGLGCLVNNDATEYEKFRSDATLLDYDVVIWDPETTIYEYRTGLDHDTYRGLPCLDDDDSVRFVDDVKRRGEEIRQLLELGRTVVLFASGPACCYVDTGERQVSGTGRNTRTTRVVREVDLFSVLPFKFAPVTASGKHAELRAGEPFAGFWRKTADLLEYRAYFDIAKAAPLLVIAHTDRTVGALARHGLGFVLVLPAPYWDQEQDTDFEEDEAKLLEALEELILQLRQETGDFTLPAWSSAYRLPGEDAHRTELAASERVRDEILGQIDAQKNALATLDQRKLLFTGTGLALETQAKAAFRALGFTVTDAAPGRDDFIATRADTVAVVEVKGVAKSGAEKHAAQLEKWVAGHYEQHGQQPKGILVVNAYADTHLEQRTDPSFPDQMLPYSKGRGHALVTGLQLLGAWLDVEAHPDRSDEIAGSLVVAVGPWDRYTDWTAFLDAGVPTAQASA